MRHIVLVGPMGAGKSTVGEALAGRLGVPFRDSDEELWRATGCSARELAARDGLDSLHRREAGVVLELLAAEPPSAVAAAASVVEDPRVRDALADRALVVWLRGDAAALRRRARPGTGHRPDPGKAADPAARDRQFAAVADAEVDAECAVAEVVDAVAAVVAQDEVRSLRLLGGCGSTALVDDRASITWWCAPEPDDLPILWRLLDLGGSHASWVGARAREEGDHTAGPVLRTIVDVDGIAFECRDGIVRRGDSVVIARLVRAQTAGGSLVHELVADGFDPVEGRPQATTTTPVAVEQGRWAALTITAGPAGVAAELADPDDWTGLLDDLERRHRRRDRLVLVPGTRPQRTRDALAVLVACTDPRSGGTLASPTTSVPEAIGGDRQWDYRYSWLRDASMAASVAAVVGDPQVAKQHLSFLRGWCGCADGDLPAPLRRVDGEPAPDEREVPGRVSWGGSKPVRLGNDAREQVQLDAYGAVVEGMWLNVQAGGRIDRATWRKARELTGTVLATPPGPSSGIWELREPADLISADIGRWLLFDRACRLSQWRAPLAFRTRRRWRAAADEARDRVLGALRGDGSLPQRYDDVGIDDASALLVVLFGMLGPDDPRAARLVDATLQRLAEPANPVLVRRYNLPDDGFTGREGAFVPVSWWAVATLAVLGRVDDARRHADALCESLPRLQPEELDGHGGGALGNVPLVWSHMECARALYLIDIAALRQRFGGAGVAAWRAWRYVRLRARASLAAVWRR